LADECKGVAPPPRGCPARLAARRAGVLPFPVAVLPSADSSELPPYFRPGAA